MEATVRNVRVDAVKVKVWAKIDMFDQDLCDKVVPLSPKYKM